MCKELVEHYEAGFELGSFPHELLEENKWLAARYGLTGELIDLPQSARVPARELARRLVERLRPHAQQLGSVRELDAVSELIEGGTGAERQLADWRADRDLRALVRKIVASTARGTRGRVDAPTRSTGGR
jgi:carboxylate-amine ligase